MSVPLCSCVSCLLSCFLKTSLSFSLEPHSYNADSAERMKHLDEEIDLIMHCFIGSKIVTAKQELAEASSLED